MQTISCLLIHPNPDSALNPMAGSLLQDDYNEFSRQARLMTSIHAPVPFAMKHAVLQAKQRGEDPEMTKRVEKDPEFRELRHAAKTASLVMKKRTEHHYCKLRMWTRIWTMLKMITRKTIHPCRRSRLLLHLLPMLLLGEAESPNGLCPSFRPLQSWIQTWSCSTLHLTTRACRAMA